MKQMLSDEHRSALVEYRLERAHHTLEEALPLNFSNRLLQQTAKERLTAFWELPIPYMFSESTRKMSCTEIA